MPRSSTARGLYARKFFKPRDLGGFAWQQTRFRLLGRENLGHVQEARESALSFAAGHRVEELTAIGEEVFDEVMAAKIWPGTRALAQMHLDAGQRVWLVTATPVEVAAVIARKLGLTGALGSVTQCAAYSDSANDIPMLELVGRPCAVNPDGRLRAHARANGWRVRDYRTGRKAAKVGVPAALGVGAAAGAVSAGLELRRRRR